MTSVLAISGSPSVDSRTALVTGHLVNLLAARGIAARQLAVRELPATELLAGRSDSPAIRAAADALATAEGVIVATPVYKASYTGLLKAFLDLLPQSGLAGKAVLPVATGGSLAHLLAIDYALRPVLSALGARHVVAGCFLLDKDIERLAGGAVRIRPEAELRLLDALDGFVDALTIRTDLTRAR
ncbi:FMN reductase [Kitasatospora sp. GP30]|uniref:NADPH-dependent FMN reductase n=1 Tax=Kitasatospora sp. GP30 TaxID=3035084 RepID=UPI000C709E28|nr:NADPH-dependent FMN reductase [Kitasatospora sp. GP30]MDH6143606.1 FMN reductase [Kitasatospora sp. GP30]